MCVAMNAASVSGCSVSFTIFHHHMIWSRCDFSSDHTHQLATHPQLLRTDQLTRSKHDRKPDSDYHPVVHNVPRRLSSLRGKSPRTVGGDVPSHPHETVARLGVFVGAVCANALETNTTDVV
jgi:hypothetical protein